MVFKKLFCCLLLLSGAIHYAIGQPLLQKLSSSATGVNFVNLITENDSLHVMKYEYLYNGHGIGVGDFNKDGLPDFFISGNTVAPALYLNRGDLRFEDITRKAGIGYAGSWATGVSIADVNGDGWEDIYVCHSGYFPNRPDLLKNELFINKGQVNGIPQFEEMAAAYGLDLPGTLSTQAVFFDYDLDGDLDMFLVNHSNHTVNPFLNTRKVRAEPNMQYGNRLFRQDREGEKISFTDVTLSAGIINNALNFGLSATVSDLNEDGWPDIYTTSDYTETDCFYVNNGDGTFREELRKSFTHVSKYSMGSDIADYNNDGYADVVTLDMLPEDNYRQKLLKGPDEYDQYHLLIDSGYYHQQMRNMLHLNMGRDAEGYLRFSEIGQLAGVSNTDWSWSALFADLDNDGWKDLVVTNGYLRDFTDLDFLKYTAAEAQLEAMKKGNVDFRTFDLVRKMPSNKLSSYVFRNNGDLSFKDVTKEWGFFDPSISNSAVYVDLDNDGDLDLIVGRNNEPVAIFKNNATEKGAAHYIRLRLQGAGYNTQAIGTKVCLYTTNGMQMMEKYQVRGYQSTVSGDLHFGLGNITKVDSVKITWPKGESVTLYQLRADSTYLFTEGKPPMEGRPTREGRPATEHLFNEWTKSAGIQFKHRENHFIDFKDEVLLPYQLSKEGPALASGDVNGDGLKDIFIGGAIDQPAALYLQQQDGSFAAAPQPMFAADAAHEDVDAVFADFDGDGDLDLYVVSGGNEYENGSPEYNDRIYLNNGKGEFVKAEGALPHMQGSKSVVAVADFDNDGDPDLFVGGKSISGAFPKPARSYLLRNNSANGQLRFEDVTAAMAPALIAPGMVSAAVWVDLNKDNYPELLVGGDWMPLLLFGNESGKLRDLSGQAGLAQTSGMWASILTTDIDGDGDVDFIVGNSGTNLPHKATPREPMEMFVADIDNNGSIDPLICYYIQGQSYPVASRDELLEQVPALKKKFVFYKDYAKAKTSDIIPRATLRQAEKLSCEILESIVLVNNGSLQFTVKPLPPEAQFSKLQCVVEDDFDGDGQTEYLLAGNFFPYNVRTGRSDASLGLMLRKGERGPKAVYPRETGFFADGDIRKMLVVPAAKGKLVVIAKNDDQVQVFKTAK